MLKTILPVGSVRRKFAIKVYRVITFNPAPKPYQRWAKENNDQIKLIENIELSKYPLISVVIPVFNTPLKYLLPCVYSVVSQAYTNWELIIVDASNDNKSDQRQKLLIDIDSRVKLIKTSNQGISANTNIGLKNCSGEYVGFLDHDDFITDDALLEVAKAINSKPKAGLIYSDEDKVTEDGSSYLAPHFKPDWSPDLLTHLNYITHFMVVKKEIADQVSGFDSLKDGAQDYDFVLKISDLNTPIVHISKILYHWRIAKNSTASDVSNKQYIKEAGVRALKDHFARLKVKADVKPLVNKPGFYESIIHSKTKPTVIISNFTNTLQIKLYKDLLVNFLPKDIDIKSYEVTNGSSPKDYLRMALNSASNHAIFINEFVFPQSLNWPVMLGNLLELSYIHAASSIIYRQNKEIEDAGLILNGQLTEKLFECEKTNVNTYFGDTDWTRNVDYLTGKVIAVRSDELLESLDNLYGNDVIDLLHNYSKKKADKFNTVLATFPLVQLRTTSRKYKTTYFNSNLSYTRAGFELTSTEQQTLDALLRMVKEIDENRNK